MVATFGHVPATQFDGTPALDLKFPALPRTVTEVPQLVDQAAADLDIGVLAEIIEADPVVAPAVMRRINSAYYGLRRRVGDVRQAVALLGFLEVSNIALTSGMLRLEDVVAGHEQADIFRHIMRLSIGASFYARQLAVHLELPRATQLATVGLFHSLGRLILLHNRPDDYEALWLSHQDTTPPPPRDERAIFGTDHPALSAYAANQWHFPELVGRLLSHYANPDALDDASDRRSAYVVGAAAFCAQLFCLHDRDAQQDLEDSPLAALADAFGIELTPLAHAMQLQSSEARSYVGMMLNG